MCFTCHMLEPINQTAEQFAIRVFNVLAPGALLMFKAFIALWLAIVIFKLLRAKITLEEVVIPALAFTLITVILQGHSLFWEYIYRPLYDTALNLLATIIQANHTQVPVENLQGLLGAVENAVWQVIQFAGRLQSSSGWLDIIPLLAGFVLMIPYLFLLAIFMVYTIEFLFKLLIVSALSPLFIVAAGFSVSRSYSISALKVILQAILTLCIAVICMGLTLNALAHAIDALNLSNGNSLELNALGEFSLRLCALFALGVTAVIFQQKAPAIASSIIGSEDGPGFSGMATMATWKALKTTTKLGGNAFRKGFNFLSNRLDPKTMTEGE